MIILTFIKYFIKILRSNESASQIAAGFAMGMFMGITPFWSLLNFLLMIIVIILNVNIAAVLLAYAIFSTFVYLFDPLLHGLGFWLLANIEFLKPFWTFLYHAPIFPFTDYNNSVYLGSMTIFLAMVWPVFRSVKNFILHYRDPRFKLNENTLGTLRTKDVPVEIIDKLSVMKSSYLGEKRMIRVLNETLSESQVTQYQKIIFEHTRFPSYEEKIQNAKWVKWVKATPFYRWYERIEAIRS